MSLSFVHTILFNYKEITVNR